jgi:hypothetical protein
MAGGGSITTITGSSPVAVTNADPARPNISVAGAVASTAGAGGSDGLITAIEKEKLAGIASGAKVGTVTNVSGTAPIHVATPTSTPVITVDTASATATGVVQIADAAAITAGVVLVSLIVTKL